MLCIFTHFLHAYARIILVFRTSLEIMDLYHSSKVRAAIAMHDCGTEGVSVNVV